MAAEARPGSAPGMPSRRLWHRIGVGALLILLLSLHSFARALPTASGTEPPGRFQAQAALEPMPAVVGDSRFSLRAALEPRASSAPAEGVGFRLSATIAPKSGLLCHGPGHIFASGFEPPKE
jgi:hypothetical protein